METTKLNLGCGADVRDGYANLDAAAGPGVDIVHDLRIRPWPLPSGHFTEVRCVDLLEHLPDTIPSIEEIWRICAPDAQVDIRVPYWNSRYAWKDPQHMRPFQENLFDFFDPSKPECQKRPYYSTARFTIEYVVFEGTWLRLSKPWTWKVPLNENRKLLNIITKFSDVVHFLNFRLRALK